MIGSIKSIAWRKMNLTNLIKYNKVIYGIYYYFVGTGINIVKLFVKTNPRLILFNSYAGRKYDDSPKVIYEAMKDDPRFKGYEFVWAFHHPEEHDFDGNKIKTNGLSYFICALKARAWITNSSIERGLSFKGKKTICFNTWHGSPIKKMGTDIASDNLSFKSKGKMNIDYMNAQSLYEADIFSRCFDIPRENFIEVGLPRNDELAHYSESYRNELKSKLGISEGKKILLYCPTFREYEKDENYGVVLAPPMNLQKWKEQLGNEYVLLFRAHYEVTKVMEIQEDEFVKNVTDYPSLNELMIASDILISDYSSVFFDYAIMDKCIIHFTYDYEKYEEKRGMYFDIREYFSGSEKEDDIIQILKNLDCDEEIKRTQAFRNKYIDFYGDATKKTIDFIYSKITG